ncbi:hypothetical protein H8L32_18490 [Undibacterium sp. CY18W]|uniref:HEAT repeat domain-containing protein n=1 Tax=Undibacterium hunanense TaxID=2762292 RepID=A0ABR6ZUB6_9BURK|nr:hypothetical protein [Undibacterium hunanense]MBC3919483.1 hypothetical protein [Undibacterium hunanense]
MKYFNKAFLAISIFLIMTSNCLAQAAPEKAIKLSEFKEVLKTDEPDEIVVAFNRVKRNQRSWELISFTMSLWLKDKKKYPELNWTLIDSPLIRLETADTLLQANYNGFIKINKEEFHAYARKLILEQDQVVKSKAISAIGILKNKNDIELLRTVALEENPVTFTSTIIALSSYCGGETEVAIKDIHARIKLLENKKRMLEIISSMKDFRPFCRKN